MASNTDHRTLFNVQPSDHDTVQSETVFPFSDYDQFVPGLFVPLATFFALPKAARKDKIILNLKQGLERTLATIPIFVGKLSRDVKTGDLRVVRRHDDTTTFAVHDLEAQEPEFPSFDQWSQAGFPDLEIAERAAQLSPPGSELGPPPMYMRLEDGCPMFIVQLNFIRGGAILIAAFHHSQSDASSVDMFMQCWAENSKSVANGSTTFSSFKPSFDRKSFNGASIPSAEEIQQLKQEVLGYKFIDIAGQAAASSQATATSDSTTPAAVSMPTITSQVYHLPASRVVALKQACEPLSSGQFVSTYDSAIALTWQAITRARLPNHPEWNINIQKTQFQHAVNMRTKFDSVPTSYIGNGVALVIIGPTPMAVLLDPENGLRTAALTSRQSITNVDERWIPRTAELVAGLKGKEMVVVHSDFMFGSDISSSSWTKVKAYETYDFGFGLPSAFRAAFPSMDGVVLLYPANPARGEDEGLELIIRLEESCQNRILQDKDFLSYFEVRGNGRIA